MKKGFLLALKASRIMALIVAANCFADNELHATPVQLTVSPKQCTTLEKGQDCYVNLKVNWQAPEPNHFCLYMQQQQLRCWQNKDSGEYEQEIIINSPVSIELHKNAQPHAAVTIKYAWLYKNRISKTVRWRMF